MDKKEIEIEKAKQLLARNGYEYKKKNTIFTGGYVKEKKHFFKFYDRTWAAMAEKDILNKGEYQFLIRILPLCEINSNCLVMVKDGKEVPMDFTDVVKAVGYEERQTKRLLKSIVDKNLMCTVCSGRTIKYAVNPELYWKGGDMSKYTILKTIFYTKFKEMKDNAKLAKQQIRTLYINGRASSILYEKEKPKPKEKAVNQCE